MGNHGGYRNDIHNVFDKSCDPVELESIFVNFLSWADDLIIISTNKCGQ